MCNFVPGMVLAVGPTPRLQESLISSSKELLGNLQILPLIPDGIPDTGEYFRGFSIALLENIPAGMEIHALSLLSSLLAESIRKREAIAELCYYLPQSSIPQRDSSLELSSHARNLYLATRQSVHNAITHKLNSAFSYSPPAIAILDSGLRFNMLRRKANIRVFDYTGHTPAEVVRLSDARDELGHGTQVTKILTECLPDGVPVAVGCLGSNDQCVTTFNVIRAFAHLVATTEPCVVNLSFAPIDEEVVCPNCGNRCKVNGFLSQALPFVMQLCGSKTASVMALGNQGQLLNSRFLRHSAKSLILAGARSADGNIASYSSHDDKFSAHDYLRYSFGGDPPGTNGAIPIFTKEPSVYGTSFAAPVVSAEIYSRLIDAYPNIGNHWIFNDL